MSLNTLCLLHVIILFTCLSLQVNLTFTANTLGNETDRLALLEFKSKITEDPLQILSSWNASRHFCEWDGVACGRRHQRVTILSLPSQGLVGSISPYIGNLSFLRTFVLQNNSFHGEIPQELGRLFRLEDLILNNNSFVGSIPVNISLCSNLKNLFISRNNLVGSIPMALGSLSKLVELVLHVNKLSGVIPPSLGNISSLEVISISQNNLSGSVPHTLDQLKSLKVLAFSLNELSGEFPPSLYNLSTLEIFAIDNNKLSGNLPTDIGFSLTNLQQFLIGANQFSGNIATSLFNITGIQRIDIGENQFTGEVPPVGILKDLEVLAMDGNGLGSGKSGDLSFIASLTNCRNLRVLTLSFNRFGGELPSSIANFSNQLNSLSLEGNQLSGNIFSEIGSLQSLIILDLHANSFTGSIPTAIGNLKNLGILSLYGNQLSGPIPSSFRNMSKLFSLDLSDNILEGGIASILDNPNLQTLDLSYNKFEGVIPNNKLGLSSRLIELKIAHNSLYGSIPSQLGDLKHLETLDVSENKFSGEIPPTLGNCLNLEHLYLQHNFFQGSIPSSFGSLKSLHDLDVSSNNITGEIPKELEKLSFLKYLNFSFNDLEGEVPMEGIFGNPRAFSIVGNSKTCGGISQLELPKCRINKSEKHGNRLALKVALGVLLPSFMLALSIVIYLLQKKAKAKPSFDQDQGQGGLPRVSYNEIYKATNGFSSANLIGMGSYGSVYKGILRQDEGPIAVKVLNLKERGASKTFLAECEALRAVRHRNLLKVLTVCSSADFNGKDFKALLLEYMPNGSLESWLHPSLNDQCVRKNLSLNERVNIAIDVAYALKYLHNDCDRPLVHCDLKSSNVLLSDDMRAHVGDFGLAKFLVKSNSNSNKKETSTIAIRGTIGYIPPEYGMGEEVSKQGDIYSYGILLLEIFTGKRPTDHMFKDGLSLHSFSKNALPEKVMDIIDMSLPSEEIHKESATSTNFMKECLTSIITIGVACSMEQMKERMNIDDVLKELHSIKEIPTGLTL